MVDGKGLGNAKRWKEGGKVHVYSFRTLRVYTFTRYSITPLHLYTSRVPTCVHVYTFTLLDFPHLYMPFFPYIFSGLLLFIITLGHVLYVPSVTPVSSYT